MAVPTNTYQTYQAIGKAESFEDAIYNIAPTDTPFLSMLPRKSIENTHHQWQTDSLATAANNAQIEGDDSTATAAVPSVLKDNYTQISKKVVQTSGTNNAVAKHGRSKKEQAYQLAKAGKELKRDMEFALCQNGAAVVGTAAVARQCRGLEGWIVTNGILGVAGSPAHPNNGPGAGTAAVDGTARAFTETLLRTAQQSAWAQGGNPSLLMVGPFNRGVLDSFTGFSTRNMDSEGKKLTATIEIYVGPFGRLKAVANRFQRDRTAFLLDTDYWALGTLRPIQKEELAKTGDSEKTQIITEYTLISKQEAASAAVRDLTVA
jgi:hypothetical protein